MEEAMGTLEEEETSTEDRLGATDNTRMDYDILGLKMIKIEPDDRPCTVCGPSKIGWSACQFMLGLVNTGQYMSIPYEIAYLG